MDSRPIGCVCNLPLDFQKFKKKKKPFNLIYDVRYVKKRETHTTLLLFFCSCSKFLLPHGLKDMSTIKPLPVSKFKLLHTESKN